MNETFGAEFLIETATPLPTAAWGTARYWEFDYLLAFGYKGREMA